MFGRDAPILVAGGGLGGLTTALSLGRKGHHVRVLEQSPTLGAIGYGIQLGPNVFRMFDLLGISEQVKVKSHLVPALLILDALSGDEIIRISTGTAFVERFKHPYVVLHRVDLHDVLLEACRAFPNIELSGSTTLSDYEDVGSGVVVSTAEGAKIEGCALVACDGLNSRVRARIAPNDDALISSGFAAHRTIVPRDRVPAHVFREEVILWGGPGFHIVCYPLRDRSLYNIVSVFRTPTHAQRQDPATYKREIQDTYRHAHPDMQVLLGLLDLERRWSISDRDPIPRWSEGRVTLLGDAAHPTLQSLAQGAGMAIEDGVCLAACIEANGANVARAFQAYEAARVTRTARVQLESRALWQMYHCGGIAADVRRATFASRTDADYVRWLSWLFDGITPDIPTPPTSTRPAN